MAQNSDIDSKYTDIPAVLKADIQSVYHAKVAKFNKFLGNLQNFNEIFALCLVKWN